MKNFLGGEFFYSPFTIFRKKSFDLNSYLTNKFHNRYFNFTFGAYYSLLKIIDDIQFNTNEHILFPSYLCPSILRPFKEKGVNFSFYKINDNLEIDIKDLESKINNNTKAVFFIHYFGFSPNDTTLDFLKRIKEERNITLLQDVVPGFFSDYKLIGNYIFNSFRKFFPIDGSVIITEKKLELQCKKDYPRYFFDKMRGQFYRYLFIRFNVPVSGAFLNIFNSLKHSYYEGDDVCFNKFNRYILSKYDINEIVRKRRENYNYLLHHLNHISLFKDEVTSEVPIGFPIIIKNRDKIRKELIKKNIFCPIHWLLSSDIDRTVYPESWNVSDNMLLIPIDERIGREQLDYFLEIWNTL